MSQELTINFDQPLPPSEQQTLTSQPKPQPVVCLGITFENDEQRREHFRNELRSRLPELRKIEGFPIGTDDDIINLSDPPYYTACPNPWLNDFVAQWESEKSLLQQQGKRKADFEVNEPYASDISEGRSNPVYVAHSYHTKVPHPAIMRYILHYTQPGDIVYDGFAGTGMTGVAANLCGSKNEVSKLGVHNAQIGIRHCICGDLSPFASNISQGYNLPCNTSAVKQELARIYKELVDECGWMYEVQDTPNGSKGHIHFVVWSDVFICPSCGKEYSLWDVAIDHKNKCLRDKYPCPYCSAEQDTHTADIAKETYFDTALNDVKKRIKEVPGMIVYSIGKKRSERGANDFDNDLLEKINDFTFNSFYPITELPQGDKTNDPRKGGLIYYTHQFYTKRNLITLSKFYEKIERSSLRNKLNYVFTSLVTRSNKMNRFSPRNYFFGGGGWVKGILNGTLYVPSLPVEVSALEQLSGKIDMYDGLKEYLPKNATNAVSVMSACAVPMADNSVDYVFTDPPFGANIMYSELNFVQESWLKVRTNNTTEAIVNKTQQKGLQEYQNLMNRSLREYYRILKPGKWLTMEFSNTSAAVWNSIQNAMQSVGFVIAGIAALDKQLGSFNAVTTTTAVKQDLVITCYKPSKDLAEKIVGSSERKETVWDFVQEHLEHLSVHIVKDSKTTTVVERSPKILYDRLISYYIQNGFVLPIDAAEFQQGLRERFVERDGMFFTAVQAAEYEEKRRATEGMVPMGIVVDSEAEGIAWLKVQLQTPQTYQQIHPQWMQAINGIRKGDILPELKTILEENFIETSEGKWRLPNSQDDADMDALRRKALMREFNLYRDQALRPKSKLREVRVEAIREGLSQCYKAKDFATIVAVCNKIPENLLNEDPQILMFYNMAQNKI